MHRTDLVTRHLLSMAACVSMALIAPLGQADEIPIARYSTLRVVPVVATLDPLAVPVNGTLPNSVITIGEAIELLLAPSGYRLAPDELASPERAAWLAQLLPMEHRTIGSLPLRAALTLLADPAFTLIEDPVHRLISFERCDKASWQR